jgi:hypothetical protein
MAPVEAPLRSLNVRLEYAKASPRQSPLARDVFLQHSYTPRGYNKKNARSHPDGMRFSAHTPDYFVFIMEIPIEKCRQ